MRVLILLFLLLALGCSADPVEPANASPNRYEEASRRAKAATDAALSAEMGRLAPTWTSWPERARRVQGPLTAAQRALVHAKSHPIAPDGYSTYLVIAPFGPLYLAENDPQVGWQWWLSWTAGDHQILRDPEPFEQEYAQRLEALMSLDRLLWIDPDPPRIVGDVE